MTEPDKTELFVAELGTEVRPKSFTPDEMVLCDSCLRDNPPTRPSCLYCGAPLAVTSVVQSSQPDEISRSVAESRGFYLVTKSEAIDQTARERIAKRLQIKPADLPDGAVGGGVLPLASTSSRDQAEKLVAEFQGLGVSAILVEERDLAADSDNKKIRVLEFSEQGLIGQALRSADRIEVKWDDLILLVAGRIQSTNVEDVVRRKRGGQKPLDRRELSADESIFDLYSLSGHEGWRITAGNFDFSCLGDRKGVTTFENFRALIDLLAERGPQLEIDNSYLSVRALLAGFWPLVTSTKTGGWHRSGAGKVDMSTVTTTDNENQFNNYSRLIRVVRMRELES